MKLLKTLLLVLMLNVFNVIAQNDSTYGNKKLYFQNQIGINATNFIKQFLSLNSASLGAPSSYDFNYKLLVGWNSKSTLLAGLRTGVGYTTSSKNSNNITDGTSRNSDNNSFAWRIGAELQQKISKSWLVYYGVDFVRTVSENNTQSVINNGSTFNPNLVTTTSTDNSKIIGWGPVIGVQFRVTKRICLATEASFYLTQTTGGQKTTSSNPNNNVSETTISDKNTSIVTPTFVNFNIIF